MGGIFAGPVTALQLQKELRKTEHKIEAPYQHRFEVFGKCAQYNRPYSIKGIVLGFSSGLVLNGKILDANGEVVVQQDEKWEDFGGKEVVKWTLEVGEGGTWQWKKSEEPPQKEFKGYMHRFLTKGDEIVDPTIEQFHLGAVMITKKVF